MLTPTLYLAEIELETTTYPESEGVRSATMRLVSGLSDFDAREKVCRTFEVSSLYGTSVAVINVELHPVIH